MGDKKGKTKTLEATAFVLAMIGMILIAAPSAWGFGFMIISQVFWGAFAYRNKHSFLLWQSIVLTGMNAYAIWRWIEKGVGA